MKVFKNECFLELNIMNISFVLKASTDIGYGHLIRSRALANSIQGLCHKEDKVHYYVIGDKTLDNLLTNSPFEYSIFESEDEIILAKDNLKLNDIVIFDLLTVSDELFDIVHKKAWVVSISPLFSHMSKVDAVFHRTEYHDFAFSEKTEVFKGLDYTLIQHGCKGIDAASYKKHLNEEKMSIAISMGGGDAANKSLKIIRELNKLKDDYTIWLMLGQGYKYSYDDLIEESKKSHHEIILAKTNTSMWKVLGLSSLLILPGGITTYEAAYAGLPTINIVENTKQRYLIQELIEKGVSDEVTCIDDGELVGKIEYYNSNRSERFTKHLNTKGLIHGCAADRIYEIIIKKRKQNDWHN